MCKLLISYQNFTAELKHGLSFLSFSEGKQSEQHTRLSASAYQGCKPELECMMALPRVVKGTPNQPGQLMVSADDVDTDLLGEKTLFHD
jgi:hypothetical protein